MSNVVCHNKYCAAHMSGRGSDGCGKLSKNKVKNCHARNLYETELAASRQVSDSKLAFSFLLFLHNLKRRHQKALDETEENKPLINQSLRIRFSMLDTMVTNLTTQLGDDGSIRKWCEQVHEEARRKSR